MKKPCDNCPFRLAVTPYLRQERAEEIAQTLQSGGMFSCHKTVTYDESEGDYVPTNRASEKWCVGALLVMENEGGADHNQLVRISQRLGTLGDLDELEGMDEVYPDFEEWIGAQE